MITDSTWVNIFEKDFINRHWLLLSNNHGVNSIPELELMVNSGIGIILFKGIEKFWIRIEKFEFELRNFEFEVSYKKIKSKN